MTVQGGLPIVVGIDAGGTMTDTILVDGRGNFTIGKAATTPKREAEGFLESAVEASDNRGLDVGEMFKAVEVVLYSGTGMLNTLLSRTGRRLGLIVTRGMEDMVLMGRGLQAWADYSYADRLHAVTHHHPEPLVSRRNTIGVTERIDHFGDIVLPLNGRDIDRAAQILINRDVEVICICLLFAHVNPAHERRVMDVVSEAVRRSGKSIEILASHKVRPVIREQSRLNSVLIEAYATGRGRRQLEGIEEAAKSNGFRYGVQTLQSFGGLTSIRHPHLHETMISGPIGGILGARHVGKIIGTESLVVSDMGGTSFDMGVITKGQIRIEHEPLIGRFKLNVPTIAMDMIGAGAGMIIKVDPDTGKVSLGPESAGADPGPVCFGKGNLDPTVCDCDAVLGRLNKEYFLGGKVPLDVDLARSMIKERCADRLGVKDVDEVAEGMIAMLEADANSALRRIMSAQGIHPSEYTLLSYGGSGPLHMAGYSAGIGFRDIITFQFAAAFSAFGCTTADYQKRRSRSVRIDVPSASTDNELSAAGEAISAMWRKLTLEAMDEMLADGHEEAAVRCTPLALMRYTGQLEDVEIIAPTAEVESAEGMRTLLAEFERIYSNINRTVSRYGRVGISVMELGITASASKVKPMLVKRSLGASRPGEDCFKGRREIFVAGRWRSASLWEMDRLKPGNEVAGPAVIEHPATTLIIHPGDEVFVDEWSILHYRHAGSGAPE